MFNDKEICSLSYLKLKEKRNQSLANFINTLSNKQYLLFLKYLRYDEKLKKQDMTNLVKNLINHK